MQKQQRKEKDNELYMDSKVSRTNRKDRQRRAALSYIADAITIAGLVFTAALVGCGVFSTPSTEIKPASSDVSITTTTEITVTPPGHTKENK